jgi:dCTP deaminase
LAFWGRNRWLLEGAKAESLQPVSPWEQEKVEAAGYRLSVGAEYYVNGDGTSTVKKLESGDAFVIGPGEFAFILTREKVRISKSTIGFISIRASIKFRGLVNVSGFQINPGFHGNLVFAVFNAGPRHVNLRYGDEIFSVWIADLDQEVSEDHEEKGSIPNNLDKIPSDTINGISGEALTAYQLSEQISDLKSELATVKNWLIRVAVPVAFIVGVTLFVNRTDIIEFFKSDPTPKPHLEVPSRPTQQDTGTE